MSPLPPASDMPAASDESLMLRYAEGDFQAFKELYQRHSHALYRFIAWRSPRQEWVDEITQDSWTALHKARATYQANASFRTFLYQIARNRLIDLVRQHQLVLAVDLGTDEDGESRFEHLSDKNQQEDDASANGNSFAGSPEHRLIEKQEAKNLRDAIDQLPSVQKEAIVLQQFNDLSLEEIATISEVSVETIKSRLRYAMRKLRQQFVKHEHTQEELV